MSDAPISGVRDDRSIETAAEQQLAFELGGERYAIPILDVQEIRGWERATAIPRAPSHILGVISLRGVVVPVMDMRSRLSMSRCEPTPTTVVIVVRSTDSAGAATTVGCVVDAVSDVVNLDPSAIRPAPTACGSIDTHFLRGVADVDGRIVMLLDLPRLLGDTNSIVASDRQVA